MKKVLIVCLFIMMVSLTICFYANGVNAAEEKITLRYATWCVMEEGTGGFFRSMAEKYEEQTPSVKIEFLGYPYGDITQQILIMANAGDAPDVVQTEPNNYNTYLGSMFVEPLDNLLGKEYIEDIYPSVKSALTYNGKIYAVPFISCPYVLVYNKELFKEAGLDPDNPPKTYQEMISYAEKLAKLKDANGNSVYGLGLTTASVPVSGNSVLTTMINFGGGIYNKAGKIDVVNKGNIEAFEFYKRLYEKKLNPESAKLKDLRNLMAIGRLGMYFDQTWGTAGVCAINPDIKEKLMLAPMPATNETDGVSLLQSHLLLIMKDSKHKEEAAKFVKYLTSKETLTEYYEKSSPFLSGRMSVNASADFGDDFIEPIKNSLNSIITLAKMDPNMANAYLEISAAVQRAIIGEETPKAALQKLDVSLKRILK